MSKDLIIAILALAFAGCCGALLVTLAKLDEQKQMTADEHANYLAALGLHNATAEAAQENDRFLREIYAAAEDGLTRECNLNLHLLERNYELQDRLSALLCPRNDHVWRDGVCVKCGRVKDD